MTELDPKTKYVIQYAPDVTKPPGVVPGKMVQFRSLWRAFWFVVENPDVRAAMKADRFRVLKVNRK